MALNDEQANVLRFVSQGHNCLITGQAVVGKSRLLKSILQYCDKKNLKVAFVCSSGIVCKVYANGIASMVHTFYSLRTADLPSKQLTERAYTNSLIANRIWNVNVIVWDEASMSSARMFEIVNSLHHDQQQELTSCCEIYPFAGKKIILVSEFLQLRPVPGKFDYGDFMFLSNIFEFAITHQVQLNRIMRQSPREESFIDALQQLRLGLCCEKTYQFLSNLSRELPSSLMCDAIHVFLRMHQLFSTTDL